jgi:hypothetical protein
MAASQLPQPSVTRQRIDSSPRLITADAALVLVERWKAELSVLRRRSPTSDAVKTLADCVDELSAAITAGHDATVQLTVGEANAASHIPVSTLRWLCKHKPDLIGARKREGAWYIDRAQFERYLSSPDGHAAVPRTDTPSSDTDRAVRPAREPIADSGTEIR